ncbi:hypothetical protein QBC37DRAFT_416284 [Rhypophila decipiens]|uniref:Uncharacterized protein n=1 Tax=Rhypophila decipiens TaxID=261697 RepID=A0AAN7BAA9_9PEZI|nr:hypothetical protein QBC37DRAFT_416284 [Rhypophila decipiens]
MDKAQAGGKPPPPRIARKAGKNIIWWPADEGSLASRSIGKVNIDCRLRLSESKWGILEGSQPAGILFVDLTFDQPAHCRLSSAVVLISLEEYDDTEEKSKDKKKHHKEPITLSRLRVCEFGPKLLTGEPTTLKRRTEYNLTPEVNAGVGGFGGLGIKRQNSINYVSRWVLKGNTLAPADKKRKAPGIVYRTLKWELTENELAFQPTERSVVHTAFAFEHELKRFYIKVEISGKLSDVVDRLKHRVFPPRLKKHQGTLLTLVDLGAKDEVRKESLDHLARRLEGQMRERNLIAMATKSIVDPSNADPKDETRALPEAATGGVDLADLARATEKFAPLPNPDRDSPGQVLRPENIYLTPTPSFSSMASTLVPSQSEEVNSRSPTSPSVAEPSSDVTGNVTVGDPDTAIPGIHDGLSSVEASLNGKTEHAKPPAEEDVKLKVSETRAVTIIATEPQFIEVLIMLRAWIYATVLAMFLRNEQSRKGMSGGGKVS